MNPIQEVKRLNLPLGQYVVFGSGILAAKNIRLAKDIDLLVLPGLFEELRRRGWKRKFLFRRVFTYKLIKKGGVEAFSHARRGPYQTSTEDIIASAEMIDGVPFMNLNELRAFKLAMGREKDMRDVELIDKFQNKS